MIESIVVGIVVGIVVVKIMGNDRIKFNVKNGCWMSQKEWDEA